MNITVFAAEAVLLLAVFTALILIPLCKNPIWWIHDFPEDIQEVYFQTHERVPTEPFTKTVLAKKALGVLVAVALLIVMVWLCRARTFTSGFCISYALWMIGDWYDCFILDWVFFANLKAVRLPGTEHMDKAYHQKKYHVIRSLYGMVIGLIPCLLTGIGISAAAGLF